jgi:hypothetical protein
MRDTSARRERGRRSRSLLLVALLSVGTACGGSGDTPSAEERPGQPDRPAADAGQQQPVPSPLGAGPSPEAIAGGTIGQRAQQTNPASPPPDLGTQRPQAPPNTVSLETLHQQGKTHVLR